MKREPMKAGRLAIKLDGAQLTKKIEAMLNQCADIQQRLEEMTRMNTILKIQMLLNVLKQDGEVGISHGIDQGNDHSQCSNEGTEKGTHQNEKSRDAEVEQPQVLEVVPEITHKTPNIKIKDHIVTITNLVDNVQSLMVSINKMMDISVKELPLIMEDIKTYSNFWREDSCSFELEEGKKSDSWTLNQQDSKAEIEATEDGGISEHTEMMITIFFSYIRFAFLPLFELTLDSASEISYELEEIVNNLRDVYFQLKQKLEERAKT